MGQLQDPAPKGEAARVDLGQKGDPQLDTALFDGIGGLRVDQILPSKDIEITAAGVLWPRDDDPLAAILATASDHRPVWVDINP
jgi:endonuclease/exonuclease/phosphatase family metal-dependent hydrolase